MSLDQKACDEAYVVQRIIDTCLRENVRGIATEGAFAQPPQRVLNAWKGPMPRNWWRIGHLSSAVLWLPAAASDAMQTVRSSDARWLCQDGDTAIQETGAGRWLSILSHGLDAEAQALHATYALEAACAVEHRGLAREAFRRSSATLSRALEHASWSERMLACDRLASYRDHPFYPTARAKSGFDADDLRAFAPEFDPAFELRWLAVPKQVVTLTSPAPACWPSMENLGLPRAMDMTHAAIPIHPMTWARLGEAAAGGDLDVPAGTVRAPRTSLTVRPTLSVRTVMSVEHPDMHIKLPLLMRTLGACNIRLIKPSTIYDGHWFERVLRAVGEADPALRNRYVHADEAHGGHVAQARHLSYMVRRYPELANDTPVPVAALCASFPDGRPMAVHLSERFHGGDLLAWWQEYAALLCDVHLRLWLVHGIALESNQQNAVLIYRAGAPLRLLMKDNDAARVLLSRLHKTLGDPAAWGKIHDPRIPVADDTALAQMFCTITLQLGLVAVIEGLAETVPEAREAMYASLREMIEAILASLVRDGVDIAPARALLDAPRLPVKYLLCAGSLLSKAASGAADINKFYGDSGPNFMRPDVAGRKACAAVEP